MSLLHPTTTQAVEPVVAGSPVGSIPNRAPEAHEEDLQALIDEQARRVSARRRRGSRILLGFMVAVMAAGGGAYGFIPGVRQQVDHLVGDLMLVGRDLRMASDPNEMRKAYDKSLEKIGTRATAVDDATRSLGVDPTTVTHNDLEAEERKLMGNGAQTVSGRNRLLQTKMGHMANRNEAGGVSAPAPQPPAPKNPAPTPPRSTTPKPANPVAHDQPLIIR